MPGITADLVARVAKRTASQVGGTGAVVQNIRTAVAASVKRRQKAAAKAEVQAELAEQDRQHREARREEQARQDAEQLQVNRFIRSLDDDTLEQARQTVLADLSGKQRQVLQNMDVHKSRTLKRAIYERLSS